MRPVGAIGDSEPALQPLPTVMAIRNGDVRFLSAVAIAIGASRPVVAMLPGPADASAAPSTKYMIGTRPTRPRQRRIALCATISSVPLTCACANSNVTPDNVTKRSTGKPESTSASRRPPMKTPMIHASAIANSPTLSRDMHDTTTAIASATSVTAPKLIERSSWGQASGTPARSPSLEADRQQRDHDHRDDREPEVLLDDRGVAEEVAEQTEAPNPQEPARDVEREKARVAHAADTCDERRERAHDRHESREHDSLASVHLI